MKILLIVLISVIIGLFLYFNFKKRWSKKRVIVLSVLCVLCVVLALIYTLLLDKKNRADAEIIAAFHRGEVLQCGEISVSSEDFTFTNGTLSFTGKVGTKHQYKIIALAVCK